MENLLNLEKIGESVMPLECEAVTVKEEPITEGYVYDDVGDSDIVNENESSLEDPFCFETDHVALRNNQDYQDLLRTIVLLEAQRTASLKDIDTLVELREKALEDPLAFVDKLQRRVNIGIPRPIKVANLPVIDWSKYSDDVDAVLNSVTVGRGSSIPVTRNKLKASIFSDVKPKLEVLCSQDNTTEDIKASSDRDSSCAASCADESSDDKSKVKGRSVTFNKKWSPEEQQRFEELLRKHPPERNQTKRHMKIAKELETRNTTQVASHMQKYFLKLAERKLPIPGPKPNNAALRRRTGRNLRHRYRDSIAGSSSTFLMSYQVPVNMSEIDRDDEPKGLFRPALSGHESVQSRAYNKCSEDDDSDTASEEDIPQHLKTTSEFIELQMWKNFEQQQQERQQVKSDNSLKREVPKCYVCSRTVEVLETWKCLECSVSCICVTCSKTDFNDGHHSSSHLLERVESVSSADVSTAVDRDYDYTTSDTYSYLDPNYKCD